MVILRKSIGCSLALQNVVTVNNDFTYKISRFSKLLKTPLGMFLIPLLARDLKKMQKKKIRFR